MKGFVTTADTARADERGKVSAIGGFWSRVKGGTVRMSLVIVVRLEPGEEGTHQLRLTLRRLDSLDEAQLLGVEGEMVVSAVEDASEGTPIVATLAMDMPPVELAEGLHEWTLEIDGQQLNDWPFMVADE